MGAEVEDAALRVLAAAGEELTCEVEVIGAFCRLLVAQIIRCLELLGHAGEGLSHGVVKVGGEPGSLALHGLKFDLRIPAGAGFLRELLAARADEITQHPDPEQGEKQNDERDAQGDGADFSASAGQIFNLLDWSSLSGGNVTPNFGSFAVETTFCDGSADDGSAFDLPVLTGGLLWDVSQFTSAGIVVVVPEPSRCLLLAVGLAFSCLRRRRD